MTEIHKTLPIDADQYEPVEGDTLFQYFEKAWLFTNEFYREEKLQIESTKFEEVTPEFFFQEFCWVVHATGFSAKAVGKFMPRLMLAYGPFQILASETFGDAFERIQKVCNNVQKAKAVHSMAKRLDYGVKTYSWEVFRQDNFSEPRKLVMLPYIGKVTCFHLARNIGLLECVKPDLHLIRLADHFDQSSCLEMCKTIKDHWQQTRSETIPLGIIDLALWYFASHFSTLHMKKDGMR